MLEMKEKCESCGAPFANGFRRSHDLLPTNVPFAKTVRRKPFMVFVLTAKGDLRPRPTRIVKR